MISLSAKLAAQTDQGGRAMRLWRCWMVLAAVLGPRRSGLSLWLACCLLAPPCLVPVPSCAETITATDLTPEAVWEAIDAAQDGDTVQIPAGTAVWTKGWNSGHGAKMKAITIQGAGIDKTIIGDRGPCPAPPFSLLGVEGKPFRVTGITFDGTDTPTPGTRAG